MKDDLTSASTLTNDNDAGWTSPAGSDDPETSPIDRAAVAWGLTLRQRAVLVALARGLPNKEIARLVDCTPSTVEGHLTHVFRKAGVKSRAGLLAKLWVGEQAS